MDDLPRLALSIRQPWAWLILNRGKDVENRTWATRHRGPICIHASKAMNATDVFHAREVARSIGVAWPTEITLQHGGIIGVVDIVDCATNSDSPWFFGPYGFHLANPRVVPFLPTPGALNTFDWRKLARNANG